MTIAYVYKWTHIPTMKWYVGSRTRKNCHPNDGYICSSETVLPMIALYPSQWKREIIDTGSKEEMIELEEIILSLFNAATDPSSLNKHNATAKFNGIGLAGIPKSASHREKLVANLNNLNKIYRVGKPGTFLHKRHSESTKKKLSESRSGINGSNGWYIDSSGNRYETAMIAAAAHKVSHTTIYRWVKVGERGWSFMANHITIPYTNGQTQEGEN